MSDAVFGLDPATYRPHALHAADRIWPETNCYVDLMIEVLAARGHDPLAMLGFTLTQDFEGDQFTFFKVPTGDLEALYGLDIQELSIFDRLDGHVAEQIRRGNLVMVEMDAHFLPDTAGVTYRSGHSKTTVGIDRLDVAGRAMTYFHNAGFFALSGEDFDGLLGEAAHRAGGLPLFPYTEVIRFGRYPATQDLWATARELLRRHLARRPASNPFRAWGQAFPAQAADLATRPGDYFHTYAFNTPRQFGANFELLASHLDWLCERFPEFAGHSAPARAIAEIAKTFQFKLARAMARSKFDGLDALILDAADHWDRLMTGLDAIMAQQPVAIAAE
jgi:hypothetical protein